jgi:hypothetical protein
MTITYENLQQEPLPAASTLVYTIPTLNDAVIVKAEAFNYSTSTATITINIVQSGGSVADTNKYYSAIVPAGQSLVLSDIISHGLNSGDMIYAIAGTATSINLYMRVKESV